MVVNRKQKSKSQRKHQRKSKTQTDNGVAKPTMQLGGSPASTLVMEDTTKAPVMNDYVVSDRIRQTGYDSSLASIAPGCGQKGGSPASDLVMENLVAVPETKAYPESAKIKGDMNSLNLYQTTGGSRRNNRNNRNNNRRNSRRNNNRSKRNNNNRSHKNKRNNNTRNNKRRTQRGGGSDWLGSQNSLGNINAVNMSSPVNIFSQSEGVSRDILMNPPTLGLAGSGAPMSALEGGNVRHVGAPLV